MRFFVMFVTAVCVLFLIKLRWPKKKNFFNYANYEVFDNSLKSLQKLSEGHTNVSEHFPNISTDDRRLLKTSEADTKTFRSYIDKFKFSYGNYGYFTRTAFLRAGNPVNTVVSMMKVSSKKKNTADFLNYSKTDRLLFLKNQFIDLLLNVTLIATFFLTKPLF